MVNKRLALFYNNMFNIKFAAISAPVNGLIAVAGYFINRPNPEILLYLEL